MTVQELINELLEIEDKEQQVYDEEYNVITNAFQDEYGVCVS